MVHRLCKLELYCRPADGIVYRESEWEGASRTSILEFHSFVPRKFLMRPLYYDEIIFKRLRRVM